MAKWGEIKCPRCAELEAALPEQIEWVKRLADDLNAAEGREARLKAKLAKAEEMLEREIRRVQKIQRDLPPPHNVGLVYVEAEYKLMLAELKGEDQ